MTGESKTHGPALPLTHTCNLLLFYSSIHPTPPFSFSAIPEGMTKIVSLLLCMLSKSVQSPLTPLHPHTHICTLLVCWWPEFDVDFGAPLGNATRLGLHSWARNFTRANVELDVSQGRVGVVDLLV